MPKLSPTQLEKLRYSAQGWNKIHEDNMRKLNDTLLKVSGMLDVDLTSLTNGDVLAWSASKQKFENVPYGSVIPTTTSTTSSTVSTSTLVPSTTTSLVTTTSLGPTTTSSVVTTSTVGPTTTSTLSSTTSTTSDIESGLEIEYEFEGTSTTSTSTTTTTV